MSFIPDIENVIDEKYIETENGFINVSVTDQEPIPTNIKETLIKYKLSIYFSENDNVNDNIKDIYKELLNVGIVLIDGKLIKEICNPHCDICGEDLDQTSKYYDTMRLDACMDCNYTVEEYRNDKSKNNRFSIIDTIWYDVEDGHFNEFRGYNHVSESGPTSLDIKETRSDEFLEELKDWTNYPNDDIIDENFSERITNAKYPIDTISFGSIFDWYPILKETARPSRLIWINTNKNNPKYGTVALSFRSKGFQFFTFNKDLEWLFREIKNNKVCFSHYLVCSLSTIKDKYDIELF